MTARRIAASLLTLTLTLALAALPAYADATDPKADIKGAKDNPLLKRYQGSFIVSYEQKAFDELALPLSPLEKAEPTRQDRKNNNIYVSKAQKELEGRYTRLVYVNPAGRSSLEVLRNYQDEIKAKGGEIIFECKGEACGGDPGRATEGGGGDQSLMMHLLPPSRVTDPDFSNGACTLQSRIQDQRYFAARVPVEGGDAYLALMTWVMQDSTYCKALTDRTATLAILVEPKAREQKMVLVKAEEMAAGIAKDGRIALYGIYFDTDKADLKPESNPTLEQIAALMKADPKLNILVVGHTDNQGGFDHNIELSKRRAAAVAQALASRHGIAASRLKPYGVGMTAPAASNDSDQGRAKNRRVELVKQ
jgi:outer membrane protein OmpA-like peptidoglycan-associated protein